jgi:Leucine-rich repeat (LRR) protein
MYSLKILFNIFFIFEILSNIYVTSNCHLHEDEIQCQPLKFYHYNSSSINNSLLTSSQTLHLTNAYYSGILHEHINKLIIEDYLDEIFPLPFISSFTLHSLSIEHTDLNQFPSWLCTYNRNLSFIEIEYSHIDQIIKHDLYLCLNLHTLRISNSYLKQFINSDILPLTLHYLYLNHNQLTEISNENGLNLNQFPHLYLLDLSYNQIKKISSENFNQTSYLTTLDLSYNNLQIFQLNNSKYLTLLETLDLKGNIYLEINPNWYDYFPHLIKISFPYAYFCCNFKHDLKISNKKDDQFHSDQVCFPSLDPTTACESLFSSKFIRFIFLIIVFISFVSNLIALVMNSFRLIRSSYNRWLISILFSSNLALADFLSSIYLIVIGIIDTRFHLQTHLWAKSSLCTLAGFIYIFGAQSSIYALALLTFERFYTILFSFKRQTPWPPKFTLTIISIGWFISLLIASLPLININSFHANSLCVPLRIETIFDRLYLSLLIIFDLCFIGIIITCNGLICFNISKSHVHTLNDARATLKILTLVLAICISRIPLIIFIFLALINHQSYSNSGLHLNNIKLAILFLQPFSSCFNPFMYSSLLTLKWTKTTSGFERPKPVRKSIEFSRFRSKSVGFYRGYHPLRMMSITSLDYRLSSLPNTP